MESEKARVYGFLSVACPIVTVASVYILQTRAHADFWESVTQSDDGVQHAAGAFMILTDFIDMLLYTSAACIVGLALAFRSIQLRRGLTTLGFFCLGVNGAPLLIGVLLFAWGFLRGL